MADEVATPAPAAAPLLADGVRPRPSLRAWPGRARAWLLAGWRVHVVHALGVLVVGVTGAAIGAVLAPPTTTRVGPIQAEINVVPSLDPGVHLLLPPAGEVRFSTHLAPFAVEARISEVDLEAARAFINSPTALQTLRTTAPDQLRNATLRAAGTTALCSLAGALGLSLLVYRRRWSRTAEVASALAVVLVAVGGVGAATFDPDKLAQPRFTGLLGQAPYVAGQASSLVRRLESYRSGLADIVSGITTLYATSDRLPVVPAADDVVTVLHVSDIHLNPLGFDLTERLVKQFNVDVVVDTGDITTWGTEVESGTLPRIRDIGVPYVFVRGNHDSLTTQQAVAQNPNAIVLDGAVTVVKGLVIAGIGDPRFTADAKAAITDPVPSPSVPVKQVDPSPGTGSPASSPSVTGPGSGTATSRPPAAATTGTPAPSPASTPPGGAPSQAPSGTPSASPQPDWAASSDPEVRAGGRLGDVIAAWNAAHPDRPVAVAAVHEPYATPPLLGHVPLVLAGHFHQRSVRLDPSGTRVMIEGSTGGAGITSDTMHQVAEGQPVPLDATLLYVARAGERAGQVVAYDEITVGGFGLASVTIQRTVIRPGSEPVLAPGEQGPPTSGPSPAASASSSPAPTSPASPSSALPSALPTSPAPRRASATPP